ncbi:hypothetical protein FVE85_3598 [Porphyridium purpureum]|uniref:Uncharacterized protein n=1 Tax=Porphyridium purpureum TaxID=35688 RepID=A0A5J4YMI2_PORPP|nr:hypothetical protein FVE85_3598 [Porphyridium purpureum]|eukprot:POR9647..scf249_10
MRIFLIGIRDPMSCRSVALGSVQGGRRGRTWAARLQGDYPDRASKWIRAGAAALLRNTSTSPHAPSWDEADGGNGTGPAAADATAQAPVFAICGGRDSFRGIVMTAPECESLTSGTSGAVVETRSDVKQAALYLRAAVNAAQESMFYGFRYGLNGSRGYTISPDVFKALLERVNGPEIERKVFKNTTQALVFCEQAGTTGEDWHKLETAALYLQRNPFLSTPSMMAAYFVPSPDAELWSGPSVGILHTQTEAARLHEPDSLHAPPTINDSIVSSLARDIVRDLDDASLHHAVGVSRKLYDIASKVHAVILEARDAKRSERGTDQT